MLGRFKCFSKGEGRRTSFCVSLFPPLVSGCCEGKDRLRLNTECRQRREGGGGGERGRSVRREDSRGN
jgi:hypothetical protein